MKIYQSKSTGVTLIELLFVIVIIAVFVSLPMTAFKRVAQQTKIEKAAMQMQQILQGGMDYYVQNRCWPVLGSTPTGCTSLSPPNFSGYVSTTLADITASPWSSSYTYSWGVQSGSFVVQFNAPSPAIAQRIAGMLPKAQVGPMTGSTSCTTSGCVFASVSPDILRPRFTLVDMGKGEMDAVNDGNLLTINNGAYRTLPTVACPSGSRGFKTIISVNNFQYFPIGVGSGIFNFPITPQFISFYPTPTYACAKTSDGVIETCTTTVTLNSSGGVICSAEAHQLLNNINGHRGISCSGTTKDSLGYGQGIYPDLYFIGYDYRSYCCSTTNCT